jgi:hypothetical protein
MSRELILVIVVLAAIAVLLGLAIYGMRRRRGRPFEVHAFGQNYVEPYERRIEEVERMFVSQPREAVAAAKLLVDDMLTRMGYPVRMSAEERVRDLKHFNRTHADRYRTANLRNDPSTEEMRRALQSYLETARDLVGDARKHHAGSEDPERRGEGRELAG